MAKLTASSAAAQQHFLGTFQSEGLDSARCHWGRLRWAGPPWIVLRMWQTHPQAGKVACAHTSVWDLARELQQAFNTSVVWRAISCFSLLVKMFSFQDIGSEAAICGQICKQFNLLRCRAHCCCPGTTPGSWSERVLWQAAPTTLCFLIFIPSILTACLWWGFKGKRWSICSLGKPQKATRPVGSQQQHRMTVWVESQDLGQCSASLWIRPVADFSSLLVKSCSLLGA